MLRPFFLFVVPAAFAVQRGRYTGPGVAGILQKMQLD
jgi:hypothetical protein